VAVNSHHCVASVQQLCTSHKPYFIIFKRIHNVIVLNELL
jgi:hypothetical protein